jgi:hypothetical protein
MTRHELKEEWIRYVNSIEFDHHITLTYPDPLNGVNPPAITTAHRHGEEFISALQKKKERGQISWLQVVEISESKPHLHLLTYRTRSLPLNTIESVWKRGISEAKALDSEEYRSNAIRYVFKSWVRLNEDEQLERFDFNHLPKRKRLPSNTTNREDF